MIPNLKSYEMDGILSESISAEIVLILDLISEEVIWLRKNRAVSDIPGLNLELSGLLTNLFGLVLQYFGIGDGRNADAYDYLWDFLIEKSETRDIPAKVAVRVFKEINKTVEELQIASQRKH